MTGCAKRFSTGSNPSSQAPIAWICLRDQGHLGIEALSRGAARCDFVDADREALTAVEQHLNTLDASDRSTLRFGYRGGVPQRCSGWLGYRFCGPSLRGSTWRVNAAANRHRRVSQCTTTGSITKPACPIPSPSRKCSMRLSGKKPLATSGINS